MIKNERQLAITKKHLTHFKETLKNLNNSEIEMHPLMKKMQIDSIEGQINEFETEIAQFENLQAGAINSVVLGLREFNFGIIESRIAKGYNHKQFAELLGIPEQQVQKYESENYLSISVRRAQEILTVLGVTATTKFQFNIVQTEKSLFLTPEGLNTDEIQNKIRKRGTTVNLCEVV